MKHKRYLVVFAALMIMALAWPSGLVFPQDDAVEPLHPKMLFTKDDLPTLRERAATTHQEIWQAILDFISAPLDMELPENAPPAAEASLEFYRHHGNVMLPLAFGCVMTDDEAICDTAKTYLLTHTSWLDWESETWDQDLEKSHMLRGNALAYDWLYDRLTEEERAHVRAGLGSWAEWLWDTSLDETGVSNLGNWWGESYMQNHSQDNYSALGTAALVLWDEDYRAAKWLRRTLEFYERMKYLYDGIEDGSWHEGMLYQAYGLSNTIPFLYDLRRIQGIDLFPDTYLRNFIDWRIYNHIPDSLYFIMAYGDFEWSWGDALSPCVLRFVAAEYDNGYAQWLAQQIAVGHGRDSGLWSVPWEVLEFLFYDASVAEQRPGDELPLTRHFPDLEAVIWRTGWETDDLVFGLKTGAYGGRFAYDTFVNEEYPWPVPCYEEHGCHLNLGHDHQDANTFYIVNRGQWLTSEREWTDFFETEHHNTILIDGQSQYRPPWDNDDRFPDDFRDSDGFVETTASTAHFDYLAADATRRYQRVFADFEDFTRHVVFVRPGYFVMLDNLQASEPHVYDWVIHFPEATTVEGNWIKGGAHQEQLLGVGVLSPQPFEVTFGDDGIEEDEWTDSYIYVYLHPEQAVDDMRFITVLYPTDTASWDQKPEIELIADTGQAALMTVHGPEGRDDILIVYDPDAGAITAGAYGFDGQVAVVRYDAAGAVQQVFAYGGTSLTAGDQTLAEGLDPAVPFESGQ